MSSDDKRSIDALIFGYCDGRLAPEEAARLDSLLRSDPSARKKFVMALWLHGSLSWDRSSQSVEKTRAWKPTPRRAWMLAAAVFAVALAGVMLSFLWSQQSGTVLSVAKLTQVRQHVWSRESPVIELGARLPVGQFLAIDSGVLEIAFDTGAVATLRGPAKLECSGPNSVTLRHGTLTATVPPTAHGFKVDTPSLRAIDHGTRFSVSVDAIGSVEVHVYEGEVLVELLAVKDAPSKVLSAQESVRWDSLTNQLASIAQPKEVLPSDFSSYRTIVKWDGTAAGKQEQEHRLYPLAEARVDAFDAATSGNVRRLGFSETVPLLPAVEGASKALNRAYYGGVEIWRLSYPLTGNGSGLFRAHDGEINRIWDSNGGDRRLYGLWVFPKSEYLEYANEPLEFGTLGGLAVKVETNEGSHFSVRFAVKSGGRYFLSQSAFNSTGTLTLSEVSLAEELWAAYDPAKDLRAAGGKSGTSNPISNLTHGAGTLAFEIPTSHFKNLEAVGIYAESVDSGKWPNRTFDWSVFSAWARVKSK